MVEKAISLYKSDFTKEQWEIICDEFDADTNGEFIACVIDLNSVSQGIQNNSFICRLEVENMYKSSETQLTAEWLQRKYSSYYTCSNCEHTESHGYPPRAVNLGKYCPNCGSKMKNPKYVSVGFTY